MRKCGAKTRGGAKCKNPAGQGTDHVGTGKCRLHGGASKGAPKGNQNAVKHGIYSRFFSQEELDEAKQMQGSIENELALARLQLFRLLQEQHKAGNTPCLDKIEEKTIVQDEKQEEKEKQKNEFLKALVSSAKQAGEEYDPDGDEDYIFGETETEKESEIFERKRTFMRRDFPNEFVSITSLIARLEQQLLQSKKIRAEIKVIEVMSSKTEDADDKQTDTELDQELQGLINGFPL